MEQIDEIMQEFLVESYENLDQLDQDLLELEEVPDDVDRLASIFRTIHTIKGTSGFLALSRLEKLTHVGESLLVPLRDGELSLTQNITTSLLQMVDAVRTMLQTIESTGSEGDEDYLDLIKRLEQLQKEEEVAEDNSAAAETAPAEDAPATETSSEAAESAEGEETSEATDSSPSEPESGQAETANVPAEAEGTSPAEKSPEKTAEPKASSTPTSQSKDSGAKPKSSKSESGGPSLADQTLRVDVHILDNVMNLVGELVLSRNQVLQFSNVADSAVNAALQKLNHVTTELQEAVMKTRMQPIRNAWSKLPRVVRDLSATCGKKVQVEMEGADTELDKTVLEAIKDPLTHIVRNSVDHGIEPPEVRLENGKPEIGTLWLRAFHEGGQVNIEIADDGKGMDLDRIRTKAIEKGIVTPEQAEAMNDREVVGLVLLPGFSTAAAVTNVSGRGVGMDVVKTNIERIGGTLDIQSVFGQGTTLRIKLPLTLAIVPALVVSSAKQNFAIPQVNLLELVRLDSERAAHDIEYVYGTPVYRLRGNLLPILYLDELLQIRKPRQSSEAKKIEEEITPDSVEATDEANGEPAPEDQTVNIVVLQAEDRQFGLVVDAITDTQEIVVKPLDHYLTSISTFAGATIMGNGSVSLILDAIGMAQKGGILSENESLRREERKADGDRSTRNQTWLLVDPGDGSQAAIQLDSVARLEEFTQQRIETVDNRSVVQYRGQIMPLVDIHGSSIRVHESEGNKPTDVVVFNENGKNIGMVVNRILDIVKQPIHDEQNAESGGSQKVIGGRVTKIVMPDQLLASATSYFV